MIDQSQSLRQTQVYQLFHGSANPTGNPTQKAQNSSWSLASPGLPIAFGFSENRVSRNLMINHHCPYLFGFIQGYTPFSDPFVVFASKRTRCARRETRVIPGRCVPKSESWAGGDCVDPVSVHYLCSKHMDIKTNRKGT